MATDHIISISPSLYDALPIQHITFTHRYNTDTSRYTPIRHHYYSYLYSNSARCLLIGNPDFEGYGILGLYNPAGKKLYYLDNVMYTLSPSIEPGYDISVLRVGDRGATIISNNGVDRLYIDLLDGDHNKIIRRFTSKF